MSPADAACEIPATLTRFCGSHLPTISSGVDGGRALQTIRDIVSHDRWNNYDQFHQTSQLLLSAYASCGASTELYTIPTGGVRGGGSWIIQEAQDVLSATLDLIEPVPLRLADYCENPWHVVQWTAATPQEGITAELVVIDTEEQLAAAIPGALSGRIVLTRLAPWTYRTRLCAAGAVAVVTDPPVEGFPDAVAWRKFGWGGLDLWDGGTPLVGFVIPAKIGDELRELHRRTGRLVARARVETRRYSGGHDVVSGVIPGQSPDDEIWAVAHSSEPGALDNASGVGACVEIARVLTGLIRAGHLPPPRRTIRLLNAYECYGFFHYLKHQRRLHPPLAGVCIDTIGAKPDLCGGMLHWHATAPGSAAFADDVGEVILRAALALRPPVYGLDRRPFLATEDTLLGDPLFGFPCPWLTNHPIAGYHSSADTPEGVDESGLAACTAAMAGYLYYLASAGTEEALEIARWQTDRAINQLKSRARTNSALQREAVRTAHEMTVGRLKGLLWTGDHAALTREFDGLAQQVDEVAGGEQPAPSPGTPGEGGGEGLLVQRAECEGQKAEEEKTLTLTLSRSTGRGDRVAPSPNLVPRRRLPLAPTPENVWPDLHADLGETFPKWTAYWADGQHTAAEVAALTSLDAGANLTEERVARHLRALARLGYVELIDPSDFLTEERLAADFVTLGVEPGMDVMIHSSLRSVGPVRGGADAVVRALLGVLGPAGTLLAPSFNHFEAKVFNPLTTPTTNGAIPEAVWRRADAARSTHPSHAVAAVGPRAAEYVRDHLANGVWSDNSPIGRLIHNGGYLLSIGVGHDRSTAYHVAEISLNVPCLDPFGSTDRIVDPDGQVRTVPGLAWRADECPVPPERIGPELDALGLQRHGRVGRAQATLVKAMHVWSIRREQLGDRCRTCPIRPERRNVQVRRDRDAPSA